MNVVLEHILIWTIVVLAVLFLIRHFRKLVKPKSGCGGTCSCSAVDWKDLEKRTLQEKNPLFLKK